LAETAPSGDPWPVWTHPRVSPDGKTIAALLHRGGRWRVVLVAGGGAPRELATPGFPVGPPAWSPDGSRLFVATDASGIWNLVTLDASGTGASGDLTRVTGGAFSPAPAPDGRSLYFLGLTGKGTDLRRLARPVEGLAPAARVADGIPVLPPPPGAAPEP